MANAFSFKVTGVTDVIRRLEDVGEKVAKAGLRRAIDQATKPVLATAKEEVREETGLLRKSLGRKVKVYNGGLKVVGLVGPRRGTRGNKRKFRLAVIRKGRKTATVANPVKYARLVEFGTRHSRAFPFMRPALDNNQAAVATIIENELRAALAKAVMR